MTKSAVVPTHPDLGHRDRTQRGAGQRGGAGIRADQHDQPVLRPADGSVDEEMKELVLAPMAKFAPLRRVGEPADVAYCVLYLASDASSFLTGQLISPNGGVAMH